MWLGDSDQIRSPIRIKQAKLRTMATATANNFRSRSQREVDEAAAAGVQLASGYARPPPTRRATKPLMELSEKSLGA